jgi:hypothetical protein
MSIILTKRKRKLDSTIIEEEYGKLNYYLCESNIHSYRHPFDNDRQHHYFYWIEKLRNLDFPFTIVDDNDSDLKLPIRSKHINGTILNTLMTINIPKENEEPNKYQHIVQFFEALIFRDTDQILAQQYLNSDKKWENPLVDLLQNSGSQYFVSRLLDINPLLLASSITKIGIGLNDEKKKKFTLIIDYENMLSNPFRLAVVNGHHESLTILCKTYTKYKSQICIFEQDHFYWILIANLAFSEAYRCKNQMALTILMEYFNELWLPDHKWVSFPIYRGKTCLDLLSTDSISEEKRNHDQNLREIRTYNMKDILIHHKKMTRLKTIWFFESKLLIPKELFMIVDEYQTNFTQPDSFDAIYTENEEDRYPKHEHKFTIQNMKSKYNRLLSFEYLSLPFIPNNKL